MDAQRRENRLMAVAGAAVLAFLVIALVVEVRGDFPGDRRVLIELDETFGTDLDDAMVAVGAVTDTLPLIGVWIVGAGVLWQLGRRRDARLFVVTVLVAMAGNRLLKEVFARPRPDIRVSPESVSTFSFPSGHAANTLALVGAIWLVSPSGRRRWVAVVGSSLVALVGFSRVSISVHFPSDILASWLWVGAWLVVVWRWRLRATAA